jgi:hypothetical protein
MTYRYAIVGGGPSIKHYHLTADKVWACGRVGLALLEKGHKVDAVFAVDAMQLRYEYGQNDLADMFGPQWKWPDVPIWMSDTFENYQHIKKYPLQDINEYLQRHLPYVKADYINHSGPAAIVYFLYWAFCWHPKWDEVELHIYGMDFVQDERSTDRADHRGCTEYWLGICSALGVKVKISPASKVLNEHQSWTFGSRLRGFTLDQMKSTNEFRPAVHAKWLADKNTNSSVTHLTTQIKQRELLFQYPPKPAKIG